MMTAFNDTYEVKSLIGKGGMSTVYLAEHKRLGTRWAVKEVRKQQGARCDFLAESNILKRLQHPMLPHYYSALQQYEAAGAKIRSSDQTTYYQQLGSLIESLKRNGWL